MPIRIGDVEALYRYPVTSMRGERLDVADLGWHGLEGDGGVLENIVTGPDLRKPKRRS